MTTSAYTAAVREFPPQPRTLPGSLGTAEGMAAEGTRKMLAWRVSNTMDVAFCVEASQEALAQFGRPEIFNTDQGRQFTSAEFTDVLRGVNRRPKRGLTQFC